MHFPKLGHKHKWIHIICGCEIDDYFGVPQQCTSCKKIRCTNYGTHDCKANIKYIIKTKK